MSLTTQNDQFTQVVAADGKDYSFLPQWNAPIMSISVQNLSTVDVSVRNSSGQAFTVTAGNNRTVNLPAAQIIVRSVAVGTGIVGVTIYAAEQQAADTGGSVLANIINSTITAIIQGTVNAVVSGTVDANILNSVLTTTITGVVNAVVTGTVNATITNSTLATTISGVVNTSIQNAFLYMQDVIVENNTTTLLGLLPSTVTPFTLANGGQQNITFTKAISVFAIACDIASVGCLSVWYTAGGSDFYVVRNQQFASGPRDHTLLPLTYTVPIPLNSVLHVRWDEATASASFIVEY